jgi:hypothetical protein
MGAFTVSPIDLAPMAGVHHGTGTFQDSIWLVAPASVPPPGRLAFFGKTVHVTTMLFEIADKVVPNWFGVAVPSGIEDFTKPHLFFHPTPAQAGYIDSQYPTKAGKWPELFYYMERLGYQLDGAGRNQIIVMPFLTEQAKDTGILPANWNDLLVDILSQVRAVVAPAETSALSISELAVSSFSAGMIYSDHFRHTAAGVGGVLTEVWDFDGRFSSYFQISINLPATAGCRTIQYDQLVANDLKTFHVPLARWADFVQPPQTSGEVHGFIRDFMFMHAASISSVGAVIEPPSTATTTATSTMTASTTATTPPPTPPTPSPVTGIPISPVGDTSTTADTGATTDHQPDRPPVAPLPVAPIAWPRQRQPPAPIPPPVDTTVAPAVPVHRAPAEMMATGCDPCITAIAAIVANVSTTANAALSAITAIATVCEPPADEGR